MLYEGKPVGTPDAGALWRVAAEHGAATLFTAPTALRAIKKEDPRGEKIGGYDLSRFRALFLAGERADPDSVPGPSGALDRPVIDHWWQPRPAGPSPATPSAIERLPVKYGSTAKPMPGYDLHVLDEAGKRCPPARWAPSL